MIAASTRIARSLGVFALLAAPGLAQEDVLPPQRWDAPWPGRDRADVIEYNHRTVDLVDSADGLPWSLEIEERTIAYGPEAIELWRFSPPPVPGALVWLEHYHRQLTAGRELSELGIRSLAGYLLETGLAAVRDRNGQLARVVLILEYSDTCGANHCAERKVRAFYLEDRSLWFFKEDSRRIVIAAQREPAADGSLLAPGPHSHPPRQPSFAGRDRS